MWVFGYGSLVWRPSIPFLERQPAYIEGWCRRFWQGSPDHRGLPEAPGRVATLVEESGQSCWGMAYRVPSAESAAVMEALDHREKGGYERRRVRVFLAEKAETEVCGLVYIARPNNPHYLGPASLEEIAAQVLRSEGPSGNNREYVRRLASALREMQATDDHVFALARLVG